MALKDVFKKKKPEKTVEKAESKPEVLVPKVKGKNYKFSHEVIQFPHITEKATDATGLDKYIFKVGPKANKIEIKKSVESSYGVDVTKVNIVNVCSKKRRVGRNIGWTKGYKKAIVSIKSGQKIEIMPR